ncbi:IS630 family transposase [Thalassomonas viridans]|uniref:IS630 family transposase n=1 Tax=Thalassomonas viridans TaxID=137584 RepID=A0AAE9Z5M0_9GAMM|nr:IS630 family transposase [Thalassomonas viridans]WDE06712.1 IS630 family transposase [Thalassomonas viridans]WDE07204.1 IS630 family transposase [Thalassomonas viridans]
MNILYRVELTLEEETELKALLSKGKHNARRLKRAHILLLANHKRHTDEQICQLINTSASTVYRTKRCFVEEGLQSALDEGKRSGQPRALSPSEEATLISIACTKPPEGASRWTLSLIADRLIALTDLQTISLETIRSRLKQNQLKPWQKKMWCLGKLDSDFIAQMEAVLELYARPANPKEPVVNFDEAMKQLVSHTREPVAAKPGQIERVDYEYRREAVANIFMMYDRHNGWRHAKATRTKKCEDFAQCMKALVDEHYPEAEQIHIVLDNYCTHKPGSLYKAFPPAEARRILRKITFHYTPKHASWLNMVEIEIGVMNQQCLDRRIGSWEELRRQLGAWEVKRNAKKTAINWLFDVDQAREKLHRAYDNLTIQN